MVELGKHLESPLEVILSDALTKIRLVNEVVADISPATINVERWQDANAKIGALLAEYDHEANRINFALGIGGAQERILTYLKRRVGQRVRMEELRGVAGIYEWARRVRELRVEHGWPIVTDTQRADLKRGEYVLESGEPDETIASDWRLAKDMRNLKGDDGKALSGKARGLEYLKALSPRSADKDQLQYVMKIKSYARRLRELDEEGWQIRSNVDESQLAPGTYRLASLDLRPPRARKAIKLRYQVLERDDRKCRDDGRSPDRDNVTLQIHHLKFVSHGGDNSMHNLITLCSDCHAGRHAIAPGQARDELLEPGWADDVTVTSGGSL
jgi:5-methylcytosine-specific restriction endonuclease McrA